MNRNILISKSKLKVSASDYIQMDIIWKVKYTVIAVISQIITIHDPIMK